MPLQELVNVTSREGMKKSNGGLTLADIGPELGGLVEEGVNDFG